MFDTLRVMKHLMMHHLILRAMAALQRAVLRRTASRPALWTATPL